MGDRHWLHITSGLGPRHHKVAEVLARRHMRSTIQMVLQGVEERNIAVCFSGRQNAMDRSSH